MANVTITFDKDSGTQIQNSKNGSALTAIMANPVDLFNCDTEDYVRARSLLSVSLPVAACKETAPYFGISITAMNRINDLVDFDGETHEGLAGYEPYFALSANSGTSFAAYLLDSFSSILGQPTLLKAGDWKFSSGTWVLEEGLVTTSLTVPTRKAVINQCNATVANSVKASVSVSVKDPDCRNVLVLSMSAGLTRGVGQSFILATPTSALAAMLFTEGQLGGLLPGDVNMANIALDTITKWRVGHPASAGSPYSLNLVVS